MDEGRKREGGATWTIRIPGVPSPGTRIGARWCSRPDRPRRGNRVANGIDGLPTVQGQRIAPVDATPAGHTAADSMIPHVIGTAAAAARFGE